MSPMLVEKNIFKIIKIENDFYKYVITYKKIVLINTFLNLDN